MATKELRKSTITHRFIWTKCRSSIGQHLIINPSLERTSESTSGTDTTIFHRHIADFWSESGENLGKIHRQCLAECERLFFCEARRSQESDQDGGEYKKLFHKQSIAPKGKVQNICVSQENRYYSIHVYTSSFLCWWIRCRLGYPSGAFSSSSRELSL